MKAEASVCLDTLTALRHYSKALAELKRSRSVVAFSDLKRAAARLLISPDGKPTPVALAERRRYSHIFVDEYQDTDAVQDMIFRTISDGRNLFIVGDSLTLSADSPRRYLSPETAPGSAGQYMNTPKDSGSGTVSSPTPQPRSKPAGGRRPRFSHLRFPPSGRPCVSWRRDTPAKSLNCPS